MRSSAAPTVSGAAARHAARTAMSAAFFRTTKSPGSGRIGPYCRDNTLRRETPASHSARQPPSLRRHFSDNPPSRRAPQFNPGAKRPQG
jgi:hypothetical protein